MKCPHCLVEFHPSSATINIGRDVDDGWAVIKDLCPNPKCKKLVLYLVNAATTGIGVSWHINHKIIKKSILIWPKGISRSPVSPAVPKEFADDYTEACLVLTDSAKASAALSRRCLQRLLRDTAKVKPGNLADEIQQVIDSGKLPSHLVEAIDVIRNIGNFAAHPIKSKSTGEIVPVEPGEAEWNLDVLESLFDFYFVQPEVLKSKKAALNKKLRDAGKKDMK